MDLTTNPLQLPVSRSHPLNPPPYRALTAERRVAPVRTPRGDIAWLVTRYEDARAVLGDRRFSSDPRTPGFPTYLTPGLEPPPGFFMQFDAPDHGRLRRAVSREFSLTRIEALRPVMQQILDEVVDEMVRRGGEAELIAEMALPMAARTITELLGVPYEDTALVKDNTDVLLDHLSTPEQVMGAAQALSAYFDQLVTTKERQATAGDLLGRLVAHADEAAISHPELVGMATLLLLAGYDTMVQMIGLGVLTLLEHPDQLREIREQPSLLPGSVEELLRFLTVNHVGLPRAALEDVVVAGQPIRAHDGVLVMLNAANRDPDVFDHPDEFDVHRDGPAPVAFGYGLHKCIGTALAVVELETVFAGLFRRLPTLRVVKPIEELVFRHDMVLYGVRELHVAW